uniref:PDZ domain-containing protein n=1 Tax=Cryptomonas curvata TaxID=233186 RepID=A0A7S0MK38_9CRYP
MSGQTVPRQLLDDANSAVEKLKRKLEEATVQGRKEMDAALQSITSQLKTLQSQQKSTEEQLYRSMQREKELGQQLTESDLKSTIISKLRNENSDLQRAMDDLTKKLDATGTKDSEVDKLLEQTRTLREEIDSIHSEYERKEMNLKKIHAQERSKSEESEIARVSEKTKRVEALSESLSSAEATISAQSEEIKSLKHSIELAASFADLSKREIEKLQLQIIGLQRDLTKSQQDLADQIAEASSLKSALEELTRKLVDSEKNYSAQQILIIESTRNLEAKERALYASETALKQNESSKIEVVNLQDQLEDARRKLMEATAELKRSDTNAKIIRDQLRDELRRSEIENQQLRESLRKEHEVTESKIREQACRVDEQLFQRQRVEAAASKREEALLKRIQLLESELESIRSSSVSELQHHKVLDEMKLDREQHLEKIRQAYEEVRSVQEQHRVTIARLEARATHAEEAATESQVTSQLLEKKLREAEKAVLMERTHCQHAAEQVKFLLGSTGSNLNKPVSDPTKLAKAALAIADSSLDECEEAMLKVLEEVDSVDSKKRPGTEHWQRAALGIVLNDVRVEATVPGSPACTCGLIEQLDEVLMVDGQRVDGDMAMAALRGDDEIGAVVSILLRKASTGEVYNVYLPRIEIDTVKLRQGIFEDLLSLHSEALHAIKRDDLALFADRLAKIEEDFKQLDKSNLAIQQRLSMQVGALKDGLNIAVNKCKAAILHMDATHQQVHMLQFMTEAELREQIASASGDDEQNLNGSKQAILQQQIQELEGSLKALQEELSSTQMLRREALEQVDRCRFKTQELEEKVFFFQQGQRSMRETVAILEDQLAESVADVLEHPFTVALTIQQEYDSTICNAESRLGFESRLRDDVSSSLQIPKSLVNVLSYHRGSIIAEVKLSSCISENSSDALRTGKMLAIELVKQVEERTGCIQDGLVGSLIVAAEMHGPISESTVKAFKASALERERDLLRKDDELRSLREMLSDHQAKIQAMLRERDVDKKEQKESMETLKCSLIEKQKQDITKILEQARLKSKKELDASSARWKEQYENEMQTLEKEHRIELQRSCQNLSLAESEIEAFKDRIYNLEVALSNAKQEARLANEALRLLQEEFNRFRRKCEQVEEIIVAELKGCVMNLNNVESEMGFFHACHMRAMSIASSLQIGSSSSSSVAAVKDDVDRSKEMVQTMQSDIYTLRAQLQALTSFSYSDPFFVSEQLAESVALLANHAASSKKPLKLHSDTNDFYRRKDTQISNLGVLDGNLETSTSKLISGSPQRSLKCQIDPEVGFQSTLSAIKPPTNASNSSSLDLADESKIRFSAQNGEGDGNVQHSYRGNMIRDTRMREQARPAFDGVNRSSDAKGMKY